MLSVEGGIVAFVDEQGIDGNIVVVNYQGGRQTRYAHLSSVTVRGVRRLRWEILKEELVPSDALVLKNRIYIIYSLKLATILLRVRQRKIQNST